jgi:hypothetical protein
MAPELGSVGALRYGPELGSVGAADPKLGSVGATGVFARVHWPS